MQTGSDEQDVLSRAFGSRLRELRFKADLTQEEVAEGAGISLTTYSKVETGKGNPCFEVICRIAPVLEVDVAELFMFKEHIGKKRRPRARYNK